MADTELERTWSVRFPKRCVLYSFNNERWKVQEPSNSECYTPSSEPFKIYSPIPNFMKIPFSGYRGITRGHSDRYDGANKVKFLQPSLAEPNHRSQFATLPVGSYWYTSQVETALLL
jgi:hypothetical protein